MTLRLRIQESQWRDHVHNVRQAVDGLIPVVKGNGYGFGRCLLATEAASWSAEIAVGTVYELDDVVHHRFDSVHVLTPAVGFEGGLQLDLAANVIPTVSAPAHVAVLHNNGWAGRVAVKLRSSMNRFGADPSELASLLAAVDRAGCQVHSFAVHLPLGGGSLTEMQAVAEVKAWLVHIDPTIPLSVSHLSPVSFTKLCSDEPTRTFRLRLGTSLWHGDKSFLALEAAVLDMHRLSASGRAGYRLGRFEPDDHTLGSVVTLAMIGAGSAHGVAPLGDGRSPFHFHRQRLRLVEAPHMHASMVVVPDGVAMVAGDWVDVQQPLITTHADRLVWE